MASAAVVWVTAFIVVVVVVVGTSMNETVSKVNSVTPASNANAAMTVESNPPENKMAVDDGRGAFDSAAVVVTAMVELGSLELEMGCVVAMPQRRRTASDKASSSCWQ